MGWRSVTVSSSKPDLLPLDGWPVPTADDLAALRRAAAPRENLLERVNDLAFPDLFEARQRRRRTAAPDWEPFRL
jgi:hypothetical protein